MTTPVQHLDNIMALNNQGCSELERGDIGAAMRHFTTTLSAIKEVLVHSREPNQEIGSGMNRPHLIHMPLHLLRINAVSKAFSHVAHGGSADQGSQYAIYSSAMRMHPSFRFLDDPAENTTIYASMVVFNLGLTLHLQGISTCCRRSLEKARALYSNTYKLVCPIIKECFDDGHPTENACFDLFVLALLNNMALVHMEFAEFSKAEIAFQNLMGFATISSSFEKRRSASSLHHCEDQDEDENGEEEQRQIQRYNEIVLESVDSMLLNATVMGFKIMSGAPAA